jgi:hypothetical protein
MEGDWPPPSELVRKIIEQTGGQDTPAERWQEFLAQHEAELNKTDKLFIRFMAEVAKGDEEKLHSIRAEMEQTDSSLLRYMARANLKVTDALGDALQSHLETLAACQKQLEEVVFALQAVDGATNDLRRRWLSLVVNGLAVLVGLSQGRAWTDELRMEMENRVREIERLVGYESHLLIYTQELLCDGNKFKPEEPEA